MFYCHVHENSFVFHKLFDDISSDAQSADPSLAAERVRTDLVLFPKCQTTFLLGEYEGEIGLGCVGTAKVYKRRRPLMASLEKYLENISTYLS